MITGNTRRRTLSMILILGIAAPLLWSGISYAGCKKFCIPPTSSAGNAVITTGSDDLKVKFYQKMDEYNEVMSNPETHPDKIRLVKQELQDLWTQMGYETVKP